MRSLVVFWMLSWACSVAAQLDLVHQHFSAQNGLESPTIYELSQDANGSLLLGTSEGLLRYDGVSFEQITPKTWTKAVNNIICSGGYIYFRDFDDQFYRYCEDKREIEQLKEQGNNPACPSVMIKTPKGILFKACDRFYDQDNKSIFEIPCPVYLPRWSEEFLYFFGCQSLFQRNMRTGEIRQHRLQDPQVHYAFTHLGKYYAINTRGEVQSFQNPNRLRKLDFDKKANLKFTAHLELPNGEFLLGSFNGLFHFNRQLELIGHYFEDKQVSALFKDLTGSIWMGTLKNGLYQLPSLRTKSKEFGVLNPKIGAFSSAIRYQDGTILLGTYDGKLINIDKNLNIHHVKSLGQMSEVQGLYLSPDDKLFAYCNLLHEIDPVTLTVSKTSTNLPVKTMLLVGDKMLYGTSVGLRDESGKVLLNDWIIALYPYGKDVLVIGKKGSYVLRLQNQKWKVQKSNEFTRKIKSLVLLGKQFVVSTDEGVYLLGEDLNRVNPAVNLLQGKGALLATHGNDALVVMGRNLVHFRKNGAELVKIAETKLEEKPQSIFLENETILLIYPTRIESLQIGFLSEATQANPSVRFKVIGGTFEEGSEGFVSAWQGNELSIQLNSYPNLNFQGRDQLYYRFVGLDDQWKLLNNAGVGRIEEKRIPAGKYTFECYSVDVFGRKSTVRRLQIEVVPPIYNRWWFWVLIVGLSAGVLYGLVKRRINKKDQLNQQELKRVALQKQVVESELKALRAQMNPHFIFNTINVIYSQIILNQQDSALTNLNAFSRLLRQALEFTQQEWVTLKDELSFLENYLSLENARFEGKLKWSISLEGSVDDEKTLIPSLFLQPFVENALLHGLAHSDRSKELKIIIEPILGGCRILIRDNGIGVAAAQSLKQHLEKTHKSFALKAIQERIDIINQSANRINYSVSSSAEGTTVEIRVYNEK